MADLFWGDVGAAGSFADTDFISYGTEAQPLVQAKMSKNIMKKLLPRMVFRPYASKITDFNSRQSDYFILPKKLTDPIADTWGEVNEFDPLPTGSLGYGRMDIAVSERGKAWRFTERAKLLANYDIEAEITAHAKDIIPASVDKDLLMNAMVYLDIVGIADAGGATTTVVGKSLAPTKTFANNTTPVTVTQVTYDATAGTIEGVVPQTLTMAHIRDFIDDLIAQKVPSRDGNGYGHYTVIMNKKAYNRIVTDPEWREMVRYTQPQRAFDGYVGTFEGQEFVLDESLFIDRFVSTIDPLLNGKAILIFLGKDAFAEAVIKPEQILKGTPQDFGRYQAYAVNTYRGESPLWFASVDGQGGGGILVGA